MTKKQLILRRALRAGIGLLFRLLTRVQVSGIENVPLKGAYILASNHFSRIDPALIFVLVERDDVTALVADKYLRYPLIRPLIEIVGGIWLHREEADFRALREARNFLQAGGMLGIAPEGTRSRNGRLAKAKTGVTYLADKTQAPVLPVAIYGSESAMRQLFHLRRPQIWIRFGQPFRLPPLERGEREAALQRNTDEIMCRIAAMLPPEYRGAYAQHPRLQEILEGEQPREWEVAA